MYELRYGGIRQWRPADGKIRSIGLSNWYVDELEAFLPQISITPALIQNEIHPYYQENDVIPYIQERGIVVQGWYPLGGRGHTAELLGDPVITEIAAAHGKTSAQVILRWNLQSRKIQNCFILNWTLTKWQESMPLTGEKNMIGIKTTPYGGME